MADFFSLGGGVGREATSNQEYHHHHQETTNSTHNWFLYKHHDQELPTYKGFELWQQQQQQQPHHNDEEQNYQILRNPIINPFGLDIGPSNDHHHHHHETNMMMRSNTITISCQDCGNQAKKDCQHMRCRTCCKSRGFQCQTHVKSTWVPAAKRRERQQQLASLQPQQQQEDNNKSKRQKDDSNTGLEIANNFPSKVNSTAVFQRVRMSSIEENEDQIAYQAAVNINGHIFKGILYDQGDNHEYNYMNGGDYDSSSGGDPVPRHHNLKITGTATSAVNDTTVGGGGGASAVAVEGSSHFLETSLYSSVNTFVAGTQFFPPSRS